MFKLTRERQRKTKNKIKKFLTKRKRFDKISKLSQERTARTLITEQQTTTLENFFEEKISKNGSNEPNTVKKGKNQLAVNSDPETNTFNESLILAQDERWRRA